MRRTTLALGSVAFIALGMLLGIGATQYVAHIPAAAAATTGKQGVPRSEVRPAQAPAGPAAWNPFQELRDMRLSMDRMFDNMSTRFRSQPYLSGFADNPGYSLSLRVQDLKDHYEVRAYLPDAKASDVNVSLLDKQTLKVQVTNQVTKPTTTAANKQGANEQISQWGQYEEIIRLPAPVKSEQMKIDQPTHELFVTLPKA